MLKFFFSVTFQIAVTSLPLKMTRLSTGLLPLLLAYMLALYTNIVLWSSLNFFKPVSGVDGLFEYHMAQYFEFGGNFSFPQLEAQI